jgi:DNA-binding HxlR family transcriptional regulator
MNRYDGEMAHRTYGQMCPVARALDVLGERWTLLVVRELLLGPKRFKDLLELLPAMGTNRLSERLRTLQKSGAVVRRTLPPPAGVPVYELTESGERLAPVVHCLGAWGAGLPLDERADPASGRAELIALGLAGACDPAVTAGLDEAYEFLVGTEHFHVSARDGRAQARSGPASMEPVVRADCDLETFIGLAAGTLRPRAAVRSGRLRAQGEEEALTRAFAIIDLREADRNLRLIPA